MLSDAFNSQQMAATVLLIMCNFPDPTCGCFTGIMCIVPEIFTLEMSILFPCVSLSQSVYLPSATREALHVFALPLQTPCNLWICVWWRDKHTLKSISCQKNNVTVKLWECFFSATRDRGRGLWRLKCSIYTPDFLWKFFSFIDFIRTLSPHLFHCRQIKCHCQIRTGWASGVYSKWRIKRQTNPIKRLLYVCANDRWNALKAKSWVQCWGTRLATNNTNYIILIFCKYTCFSFSKHL